MKTGILRVSEIASAILIAWAIPPAASAATFKSVATKDGKTTILLTGEIVEGDADTLKAAIKTANDAGKLVSGVRLNSQGGNLLEGLKLADAVRFAKVATNIAGNATCASACFLIYALAYTARPIRRAKKQWRQVPLPCQWPARRKNSAYQRGLLAVWW